MLDVARLAGVSKMTVSRVLADPGLVSEDTRARILTAIDQLAYVPDGVAGSLASRRTKFVAVILPTLTNANFADTAHGMTEVLRAAGYQILIGYTMYSLSEEEDLIRTMLPRRPDAIVVAGTIHTKAAHQLLRRSGVPVIEIWERPERAIDQAVGFSNYDIGRSAARYLISLGHRRIGALGPGQAGSARDYRGEERMRGFASVLREAGLDDDLVVQHGDVPVGFDHGRQALSVLLDREPGVRAIFAVSDISAVGALMECQRRSISVPDDLSLMGFGDFDIGRQCVPALTTMGVNAHAIGRRTGERLMSLLDGEAGNAEPSIVDVGFELLQRDSTAPAARKRGRGAPGKRAGAVI